MQGNLYASTAVLAWGDGQTKRDVPTDKFSQGREKPLASHGCLGVAATVDLVDNEFRM